MVAQWTQTARCAGEERGRFLRGFFRKFAIHASLVLVIMLFAGREVFVKAMNSSSESDLIVAIVVLFAVVVMSSFSALVHTIVSTAMIAGIKRLALGRAAGSGDDKSPSQ